MFQSTEASILCNNLSVVVTCEHGNSTSSPTHLQLIGGGGNSVEPGRCSPDTPRLTTPDDPGPGAASPRVALSGTPMPVPRDTKSHSKPPTSLVSWGPAPSTSTLPAPYDMPSAPGISGIGTSRASNVGSSDAGDSTDTTIGHGEPGATTSRLPMLAAEDGTEGRHRDIAGHAEGR
jgi:hypothetical protein